MKLAMRWPLSGDVLQAINPVSIVMSLIHIDPGRTPAPELEQRILDEVGSYGRQIGRISDALEVLIARIDVPHPPPLSEDEKEALYAFRAQLKEVRRIKDRKRPPPDHAARFPTDDRSPERTG